MADPPAKPESKGTFGFLTRKLGPLPVWAWGAIGFGAYYWYTHYGPGAKKNAAAAKAPARAQRPEVVVVDGGGRGRGRHAGPPRGAQPVTAAPQPAVAPMTNGAVYAAVPVGAINGDTYDPTQSQIPADSPPPPFRPPEKQPEPILGGVSVPAY